MINSVAKVRSLRDRRRRARRFGIPYSRDKAWVVPKQLDINGVQKPLDLPSDAGTQIAFKDIFVSDVYGLETLIRPPASIVDVGAHAGIFSLAARLYFPEAKIHSYEPNPAMWAALVRQSEIGGFKPFAEAIGLSNGKATLTFPGDSVFTQCVDDVSGDVEVTSIARAIDRISGDAELDMLKLDCEGAEWDILADRDTMRRVRNITMEYHLQGNKLDDLFTLLTAAGFRVDFVHRDGDGYGRVRASNTR